MENSHLPETLSMPNNMTLTRAYEEKRDLVTAMTYKRTTTTVVNRSYTYDALVRPVTRTTARQKTTRNDSFTYNSRSELATATLGTDGYNYNYDNIGNRKTAQELADELTYTANQLNQYSSITQPLQWSSEMYDAELAMVYYNYRHYNSMDGRCGSKDIDPKEVNQYVFLGNNPTFYVDTLGNSKRPAPQNSGGGRIPPANRSRDNFKPISPARPVNIPPSSDKTGSVTDAVGEVVSAYDYISGDSPEEVAEVCSQKCNQYVVNKQLKQGCSCCRCSYNTRIA